MARPPKADRESILDATITIRLPSAKKQALERVADFQRLEVQRVAGSGVQFSVGHMLIKWIDDALAAHEVKNAPAPPAGSSAPVDPRQAALFPVPAASPPRVAKKTAAPAPKGDDEQAAVRKRLHAALDAKVFRSQKDVKEASGWKSQSTVSGFYNGTDVPPEKLKSLEAALKKRGA